MKFTFPIKEEAIYVQEGTVTVDAETKGEAIAKVLAMDKEATTHHGDNVIDTNSEKVLTRFVLEDDEEGKIVGRAIINKYENFLP